MILICEELVRTGGSAIFPDTGTGFVIKLNDLRFDVFTQRGRRCTACPLRFLKIETYVRVFRINIGKLTCYYFYRHAL